MKKTSLARLAAALAALAMLSAAPAWAAVAKSTETAAFAAVLPEGWSPSRDDAALRLSGPSDENGLASLIAIRYYAAGDKSFPNAESYVKRQSTPSRFDPDGAKPAAVSAARVAGRKATRIVKDRPRTAHPASMNAKEVQFREEIVVVRGDKGFYVLTYAAPLALFDENRPAFASSLAGFKPKF
jgi:hypothetical protein